jgi:hypothetical protein
MLVPDARFRAGVQVGMQARADRYAGLQVIGLQIAVFARCVCLGRGLATVEHSDESVGPS